MPGSRTLRFLFVGVFVAALAGGGCSDSPGAQSTGDGDQVGTIRASLSAADGVASARVDIAQNGMVVATQTIKSPAAGDAGAGFPFGDALFVLPPGMYQIVATPFGADGEPLTTCAPAKTTAQVVPGATTEVALTFVCEGPGNGGLDVVIDTSEPPVITNLTIDPSKFTATCAPIKLTVTASDPKGETLSYDWSVASSPPPSGPDPAVTHLVSSGPTAMFFTDLAGDYTLRVVVINTDKRTAMLAFPVHVIAGDPAQCNPRFDTLNHWSPPGPPVEQFTYGSRVHIFPGPGAVLPDPICHLTAHGGPYLPSPVVHPVLWGAGVNPGFAGPVTALMTSLFTDPQFSSYLQTLEQYTGVSTSGSVVGAVTIPPLNRSTTLSDVDVQEEIAKQIRVGVLPVPTGNDYYLVYFPPTFTETLSGFGSSCSAFCAYHGSFRFNGVNATFGVLPDCGAGACAVAGSHELIEAMTDPMIGFVGQGPGDSLAWYDDEDAPCNGEIADLCQGSDYALGGTQVAAAWSNQLETCQQVTLNPTCGTAGLPCCGGNLCNQAGTGCNASTMCVNCPAPAPTPTLLTQQEDSQGSDCFGERNKTVTFGPSSCGAGVTRASIKTISIAVSSDASCTAHWVTSNPNDCRVQVDYHVPQDCSKQADCVAQIFVTTGSLPARAVRADTLNLEDGNTLNSSHLYTIGGPCDPGYHHPAAPPIPTVIAADSGQTCAANWADSSNPNDCRAVVTYSLGDLFKQITCNTKVVEEANADVVPAGCP